MRRPIAFPVLTLAVCGAFVVASCNSPSDSDDGVTVTFDLEQGAQGWIGGFADYPPGSESFYELTSGYRALIEPLGPGRSALFISGNNHSDDLFMFFKRRLTGLQPDTDYDARFGVEIATDVPAGCVGVGGSPGESVYLKAGASTEEPVAVNDGLGSLRLNVDKGNQSARGEAAVVLGTIENTLPCASRNGQIVRRWELKAFSSGVGIVRLRSDASGTAWLFVGTDSGFEGSTSVYYTRFSVRLERR